MKFKKIICFIFLLLTSAIVNATPVGVIEDANAFLINNGLSESDLPTNKLENFEIVYETNSRTQYLNSKNRLVINNSDKDNEAKILHEYGHVFIDAYYNQFPYCTIDLVKSYLLEHSFVLPSFCLNTAFNEGFATAFSMAVRNNDLWDGAHLENFTAFKKKLDDFGVIYDFEPRTEALTSLIFWDIIDDKDSIDNSQNQDDDSILGKFKMLFQVLNQSQPNDILEFYNAWMFQGINFQNYQNELYEIYSQNGITEEDQDTSFFFNKYGTKFTGPYNDWAHFHQGLRRTGYTTLESEIGESEADQEDIRIKSNIPSTAYDKPTITDLDGDGSLDIIFTINTADKGWLVKVTGKEDKNRNKQVKTEVIEADGPIPASASLVNLDTKEAKVLGSKEIIFGAEDLTDNNKPKIFVFDDDLFELGNYPITDVELNPGYDLILDSLAVGDIDNDGKGEIVFVTYSTDSDFTSNLSVLDFERVNGDGQLTLKQSLPLEHSIGTGYSISIADIQGDEKPEIIVPGRAGLEIYQMFDNGDVSETPLCTNNDARLTGSAVVSDVDQDGLFEIVYATASNSCPSGSSCANQICKVSNFNTCASTCTSITDYPIRTVAVGNMDKSSRDDEIVVVTRETTDSDYSGNILAYNDDLSLLWTYPSSGNIDVFYSSPDIANIDNSDDDAEVVVGAGNGKLLILDSAGNEVRNYSLGGEIASAAAIADWDDDGYAEIVIKHLNSEGGVQSLASGRRVYDREVEDPLYEQRFSPMMTALSGYGMDVSILDGFNKQPQLSYIEPQYVIIGDSITLEAVATDANNDTLNYSYGYPFNSSADVPNLWTPQIGDHGDYTVLVSVTDGNLTDSQYVSLSAFRSTTKLYNQFNDGDYNKSYVVSETTSFAEGINVSNDTKVLVARFKLHGSSPNSTESSFENDAVVINANDIWETNQYSKYLVDKNWSTYYSAGSETEAIVEQRNLTVPENPKHMIIKLKATVYEAGNGRFGVYDYDEGVYELVTSSMPASFNYSDFYFDIYEEDVDALWTDNSTHYSMIVEDLSKFINGTAMRWYYDYINDDYASQRVYESEVRFLGEILYPEDIVIQINNINRTYPGKLTENQLIQTKFNNSLQKESFNFTNSSIIRYITLPKDAEILSADFKFGRRTFTEYGQVLDDFENGNNIWDVYESDPIASTVTFANDIYDSYASLYAYTSGVVIPPSVQSYIMTNNSFDIKDVEWLEITAYGSFLIKAASGKIEIIAVDEYNNSVLLFNKVYSTSSTEQSFTFPKSTIKIIKDNLTHWNVYDDGVFNNDVNITYLNLSSRWRLKLLSGADRDAPEFGKFAYSTVNAYKVVYNDINESLYQSLAYCVDWTINPDGGAIGEVSLGPSCADSKSWLQEDVDDDNRDEYYMLTSDGDYSVWAFCGVEYEGNSTITDIKFDNDSIGCYDENCDEVGEDSKYSQSLTIPQNIIAPSITCLATGGSYYHAGGNLINCYDASNYSISYEPNNTYQCNNGDVQEPYLVLECGQDEDCSVSNYCNKTIGIPLNYVCDTPTCNPSCAEWETETYSNHSCGCTIAAGRCDTPNIQTNITHYCDSNKFLSLVTSNIEINDTFVYSVPRYGFYETDLATDIQRYLDGCEPKLDNTCDVPITMLSDYNTTLRIISMAIDYRIRNFDITDELVNYSQNYCNGNCTAPVTIHASGNGYMNITDLKVYRRPYVKEISSTLTLNDSNDLYHNYKLEIENSGEIKLYNINYTLDVGETIISNTQLFNLSESNSTIFYINHTYAANNNKTIIAVVGGYAITDHEYINHSSNISTLIGGLLVTDFTEIYSAGSEKIFEIYLYNNQEENVTGINWSIDFGDGNTIYANELVNLVPSEKVFNYIYYNYSAGVGSYNLKANVTSSGLTDSKSLSSEVNFLEISSFKEIYNSSNERVAEIVFTSYQDGNNTVNWNLSTGKETISSSYPLYVSKLEDIFVFIEYNYSSSDEYLLNVTIIGNDDSDSAAFTIDVELLSIENLVELYTNAKERIFEFDVNNYIADLTGLSWDFNTGKELIKSNNDFNLTVNEDLFVYIYTNYTDNGNYQVNASTSSGTEFDSSLLNITIS